MALRSNGELTGHQNMKRLVQPEHIHKVESVAQTLAGGVARPSFSTIGFLVLVGARMTRGGCGGCVRRSRFFPTHPTGILEWDHKVGFISY
jgi:hypothetical protein